jgi:hypothetical protein
VRIFECRPLCTRAIVPPRTHRFQGDFLSIEGKLKTTATREYRVVAAVPQMKPAARPRASSAAINVFASVYPSPFSHMNRKSRWCGRVRKVDAYCLFLRGRQRVPDVERATASAPQRPTRREHLRGKHVMGFSLHAGRIAMVLSHGIRRARVCNSTPTTGIRRNARVTRSSK